ncbi:MAG: right-handed parallel beta-helix repeat-containing protein [Candidatus Thorarchaeota archaeon]
MKAKQGLVFAILASFCILLFSQATELTFDRSSNSKQFMMSETEAHYEIVITHNDNFTAQGWDGNGTAVNPFLISGLEIASDAICINISNTDLYFIIENCHLTSEGSTPSGYGISFEAVSNAQVRDIFITRKVIGINVLDASDTLFSNVTIYDSSSGAYIRDSTDTSISNSSIIGSTEGSAIILDSSDHCNIIGNQIHGNQVGFLSNSSEWISITNNTIVGNSAYGIQSTSGSKKLSVYWNRIGWNGINAIDNGTTKFWDNGNYGNWWSDSDNDTAYLIPGAANAKDRHSQLWTDNLGPDIHTVLSQSKSDSIYSIHISAEVADNIAVDQVIASVSLDDEVSWENITMDWSYTSWTTSIDSLSADSTIHYVVYASDYAENWEVTSADVYSIIVETDTGSTSQTTTTDTNTTNGFTGNGPEIGPIVIAAVFGAIAIISVVAVLMYQYPSKFRRNN